MDAEQNGNGTNQALRVLIVRVGAMGDVLHALPAVAALRQALPGCTIGWAIEPHWAPLLAASPPDQPTTSVPSPLPRDAMPVVDRLHLVPTRQWKRRPFTMETAQEIAALRRDIRAARYDISVDLQGTIRSAIIASMAGRRRVTGPAQPRERVAVLHYGQRLRTSSPHVIDQACELLGAASGLPLHPVAPSLPIDPAATGWCAAALARLHLQPEDRFVLLAPAAGWGAKEWGLPRFAALARALTHAGYRVLVNSAPNDSNLLPEFLGLEGVHPMPASLPQLIALTRHASLVVGGDTGPLHLAAALRRPALALFGPTDPARNGPFFPGARVRVLRHASSQTSHRRHNVTEAGLASLPVEQVTEAAFELLWRANEEESPHG